MSKPSRRKRRKPVASPTTAVGVAPVRAKPVSVLLGIRRAIFDGTFAAHVAAQARETSFSGSTPIAPAAKKAVDFFATAKQQSFPTNNTPEG